jgi:hypothetical protein
MHAVSQVPIAAYNNAAVLSPWLLTCQCHCAVSHARLQRRTVWAWHSMARRLRPLKFLILSPKLCLFVLNRLFSMGLYNQNFVYISCLPFTYTWSFLMYRITLPQRSKSNNYQAPWRVIFSSLWPDISIIISGATSRNQAKTSPTWGFQIMWKDSLDERSARRKAKYIIVINWFLGNRKLNSHLMLNPP